MTSFKDPVLNVIGLLFSTFLYLWPLQVIFPSWVPLNWLFCLYTIYMNSHITLPSRSIPQFSGLTYWGSNSGCQTTCKACLTHYTISLPPLNILTLGSVLFLSYLVLQCFQYHIGDTSHLGPWATDLLAWTPSWICPTWMENSHSNQSLVVHAHNSVSSSFFCYLIQWPLNSLDLSIQSIGKKKKVRLLLLLIPMPNISLNYF